MELETIIDGSLYAIKWDGDTLNSLDLMAETYDDLEYLFEYFSKNKDLLKYFWQQTTIPFEAAKRTKIEGNALIQKILKSSEDESVSLNDIFLPLHSFEYYNHPGFHTEVKAKGYEDTAPWVRVYAIKCDDNLYVITGFGLKLVQKMKDDLHFKKELKKLEKAADFLKSKGLL